MDAGVEPDGGDPDPARRAQARIIAGAASITARGGIEKFGGVEVLWSKWFFAYLPCDVITILIAWRLTLWLYPPEKAGATGPRIHYAFTLVASRARLLRRGIALRAGGIVPQQRSPEPDCRPGYKLGHGVSFRFAERSCAALRTTHPSFRAQFGVAAGFYDHGFLHDRVPGVPHDFAGHGGFPLGLSIDIRGGHRRAAIPVNVSRPTYRLAFRPHCADLYRLRRPVPQLRCELAVLSAGDQPQIQESGPDFFSPPST